MASTPKRFLDPSVCENHCRTCWGELNGGQRYKIFSVEAVRSGLWARIKAWFSCNAVEDDRLPTAICKRCYRKLEAAERLRRRVTGKAWRGYALLRASTKTEAITGKNGRKEGNVYDVMRVNRVSDFKMFPPPQN